MANRNCTGSHLARAFLRLNKVSKAVSILARFLALAAAIANPLHPLSLTLAEVSNGY